MISPDDKASESSVSKWAGIVGRWKFEGGRATYEGPESPEWPFGICVSSIRILEGEVRATVRQPNPDGKIDGRILLGYRSPNYEYYAIGLGGNARAYTLTHWNPAIGWQLLTSAGPESNLTLDQSYSLILHIRGQQVSFEVDGVPVFEHILPTPVPYGQLGLFAWGKEGGVQFTDVIVVKRAKEDRGDAFVVMQFSGFEELYSDVIEPLTKKFELRPYRADKIFSPGSVIVDVEQAIKTAQLVIAEITPLNANVFYEVGYAHALNKFTVLLAEEGTKLPFDLSGYRCIFYKNSIGGKRVVEEKLEQYLEAILSARPSSSFP